MAEVRLIDIDSHVLEPPDLWVENIEAKYKDRALRFEKDEKGWEYMCVDNAHHHGYFLDGGIFGRAGAGQPDRPHPIEDYLTPGKVGYAEGRPPSAYDPDEHVKVLDQRGIDTVILYPTLGLTWETVCLDAGLALAYARVYNDWIAEFCSTSPDRLAHVAHVPLRDMVRAVEEVRRVKGQGAKGLMVYGRPTNGGSYGDAYFDPLWDVCQELDMPVSLHATGNPRHFGNELYPQSDHTVTWWVYMWAAEDVKLGFTSFFQGGVFERFPGFKLVVTESGSGWLPHWLERMDEYYELFGFTTGMKMKPTEYFKRQCWIDMEPEEKEAHRPIELLGADRFLWAGDFPHSDSSADPVGELKENLSSLSESDQRKIMGENAIALYGL